MQQFQRVLIAALLATFASALWAADVLPQHHATLTQAERRQNTQGNSTPTALIGQPVLGYVTQPSPPQMRAILGVPGSAVLSGPMPLPDRVTRLHPAPGQAYALAERPGEDPAVIPLQAGRALKAVPVAGAIRLPDLVAFSPTGHTALLYSAGGASLQVITGLPGSPQVARTVSAGALLQGIRDAAVSDDGATVLLASAGGAYQLLPGGRTQQVVSTSGSAALAFFPNSSQAAIGDRMSGSVYLWPAATGSVSASLLSSGLAGIAGMRATADGQGLWIANPNGNSIWRLSVHGGEVRTFPLPVTPSGMDRLPYGEMFLVSSEAGQPAWIFLQEGNQALAVFVPAARDKVRRILRPEETNR